ncbi:MAG: hypothetical protein ACXWTY_00620 [Methylobacter sp.]
MSQAKHAQVDNRTRYCQLLAIGKAQLGWDEEFYRGIWPLFGYDDDYRPTMPSG